MSKFCASCGGALGPTAQFCGHCGATVAAAGAPVMAPVAPVRHQPGIRHDEAAGRPNWPILGAIGAAVVLAGGAGWYFMAGPGSAEPDAGETVAEAPATEVDEDGPLPPEWFANYTDEFLSEEIARFTVSSARKRTYPTSRGSEEISTLLPGAELIGRWVRGADGESRWLKLNDGGYVWEGNLGEQANLAADPPFIVGGQSCQGETCWEYIEAGMRSERAVDLVADIGSDRVVGRLPAGRTVQPSDYRVEVRSFGAATVSCKETVAYEMGDGDNSTLAQGTALQLQSYMGEGFLIARLAEGPVDRFLQVEQFCLDVTRDMDAVDWIRVRLADGTQGWARIEGNFQSVM